MSATKRKQRKPNLGPITAPDALQILQSAIAYCQQARITVQAANRDGALVLTLPGCRYVVEDGQAKFRLNPAENELSAHSGPSEGEPTTPTTSIGTSTETTPANAEGEGHEPLPLHS